MNDNDIRRGSPFSPPIHKPATTIPLVTSPARHLPVPQIREPIDVPLSVEPILVDPKLSERDAADILGIRYETLKKWRLPGRSPPFIRYPDGAIRYRLSTVEKFIDACTVERQ